MKYNPLSTPYAVIKNGNIHVIYLKDCIICFPRGSWSVHSGVVQAKRNLREDLMEYFGHDYGNSLFIAVFL